MFKAHSFTAPSVSLLAIAALLASCNSRSNPSTTGVVGETGTFNSLSQEAIERGDVDAREILRHGARLFGASFNELDGVGRPATTGTGQARTKLEDDKAFNRLSGMDANSCGGCHNLPRSGGGGDNVANVFVMAQRLPYVQFDGGAGDGGVDQDLKTVGNERGSIGMWGSGYIELLAREMTAALHQQRDSAIQNAGMTSMAQRVSLVAKGISFGAITAQPDGTLDMTELEGVDNDLIIKPFHQKGVVTSLRQFTNNAVNHHHGMQSSERFGTGVDADEDGLVDELSVGDITALTVWQAALAVPGRVLPTSGTPARAAADAGEGLFSSIGCASCHTPELELGSAVFTEPNPYNDASNLRLEDVDAPVAFDLSTVGQRPRLPVEPNGVIRVPAYTDMKRHSMGSTLNNETLVQDGVPTDTFLTKRLWGMFSEPPYMHHGRATTLTEAIEMHGGDAQAVVDQWNLLSQMQKDQIIAFLKTLQVLPRDEPNLSIERDPSPFIGEEPALVQGHLDHGAILAGNYTPDELFARGKRIFTASFNTLDGAGRPETDGVGLPRARRESPENFNRISGPDANSCAGCHNVPGPGGGGDVVANVFVLGQAFPFVNFDGGEGDGFRPDLTLDNVGNERGTIGMWGSGFIELLAREMTVELLAQRQAGLDLAANENRDVVVELNSKGVSFGSLVARADGSYDSRLVQGIDLDLIVKPFHQKGVVTSLRQFSNNAMNHHHGMQPEERFGTGIDHDQDGMVNEATIGDITALSLYQAMLPVPEQIIPTDAAEANSVADGGRLFESIGCAVCHIPELRLESPVFSEPNPFNPSGNLRVVDVASVYEVDLTANGPGNRLSRESDGSVRVPAYTDMKRHDLGAEVANEQRIQGNVPASVFLTKRLWGMASEPAYMHTGRATTLTEAIEMHGGEAGDAREGFRGLNAADKARVIDFLKSLQVIPE